MTLLSISYQLFMDLDYEQRDRMISKAMIDASPSYVHRIMSPEKLYNQRELVGELLHQISQLEQENKKLNETVEWMHETIWEQLRKTKALERKLQEADDVKRRKE